MADSNPDIFRKIGTASEDVYFIFDVIANHFDYLSPAFQNIFGKPVNLTESPEFLLNFIHPEDKRHALDCWLNIIHYLGPGKYEFRINQDENIKYILVSAYPMVENGTLIKVAGIAEDITVVKKNIFYAEKINARKNSMLEILAHDLKGPLGMISLMASSIQREPVVADKQNILASVKFIQDMCNRNIALVRNLVNQEFFESAEVELRKERADLVAEIRDIIHQYKQSEREIAKTFVLHSSHDKIFAAVDSLKLMQVINNLISNAIKFTPDDGVIEIDVKDQQETILITVHDNGIGIPDDLQPFLFERFTQARRPGLRGEEPVGLGMSIIKTIVELHNGTIHFESKLNEGSCFFIEIPKQ
ncbi:MAG: hypothetical protein JWQ25_437 [Daejeonella sp.]|nr:hypothetical protein [Daejeonella sp.]